jgi:hypothetical protein
MHSGTGLFPALCEYECRETLIGGKSGMALPHSMLQRPADSRFASRSKLLLQFCRTRYAEGCGTQLSPTKIKKGPFGPCFIFGGKSGIRTHGPLTRSPVFKTGAFSHSAIFPGSKIVRAEVRVND